MFKKFVCIALSLMMVLCTVSVTGFAASYESGDLVASNVVFSDAADASGNKTVTAQINVSNNSASENGSAVFWVGKYDANGVLVEAAKQDISLAAGENKDASAAVSLASDETGYSIKAYIWEKMIGGKAIATAATYNSSSTEILYAMAGDEVWETFDENTLEYDIELERTQFDIPEYKLFAKDNATKVTEPAAFVLGENKITVTSGDGSATKEYKLNISYKAPEFLNFNCASKIYESSYGVAHIVQSIDITAENYDSTPEDIRLGTDGWGTYPLKNTNGTINSPGKINGYVSSLGYNVGELFVFKTDKGPGDAANYYKGGIGKYDGTDGGYFMTFDIEKAGTMYLLDMEGKGMPNATKEGFTKLSGNVYRKHFEAGETVKVPSYGWDNSWVAPATRPDRYFMNSTIFMFGYDAGWEIPDRFDTTDATLKTLKYTADGAEYDVDGFDPADAGEKVYDVVLPYGTKDVTVAATKNEGHATVSVEPETIALTDGKATAKVTVVSFDKTVTNTYTINFTTDIPADNNADLKALEYKYGDSDYVSVDSFDAATDTYSVTLPEKTKTAEVRATAYAFDKATVEITQPVIENYKATATVKVTAADGTTVKTYTINFTVELAFEERPNKIYNLTAKESYKTDNHGYQTDKEAVGQPGKIVIGENLSTSSQRYYDRTNSTFSGFSSDMAGASYIRLMRNYHGMYDVATSGKFKRNGVEMTSYNGANAGNFRKFKFDTAAFYSDEYTGIGDADGWVEFNVTSDCTVVLGDVGNFGYPNANLAGWTKFVDNTKNYLGCASYYKTFNAGDRVKIPSYGKSSGKLADKTPVVYEYTDKNGNAQVYTTTLGYDSAHWDAITVAIKWGKEVSKNANLSSIKVDGTEVEGFAADKLDYTVMVDKSKTSVSLEAVAADSKATVDCPATINVGSSATITVTAEDKTTVKTYTVTVKAKESNNAMLSSLKYAIGSAAPVDVEGFDASAEGGSYTVAAFEYSKTPIVITLSGTAVDEEATISTTPVTLSAPGKVEAVLSVTSADTTVIKEYKVTFEMLAKVASAVVVGTDEYQALFNDGQYNGSYRIILTDPVSYTDNQKIPMLTWDENGLAKNRLYEINVDGTVYTETQDGKVVNLFKLSKAKEVKAAKEAEGKTVTLTAKPNFNYEESMVVASKGSAFNIPGMHNFGSAGAKIKTAMQVMTSREAAPGRISASNTSVYKNPTAARNWLATDGNYLFTVTPNTKATVYVLMPNGVAAKDAATYKADGWTFLDYSAEFTGDKLNALPEEAIVEAYRNLPAGMTRQWYMVEPSFTYPNAPYSLIKLQYDTGSDTNFGVYPYVWYKTIDEDETLKVPTIGSITTYEHHPIKAFVMYEEHDSSLNPASGDATLKSITIDGTALEGFAADKTDYTVDLPYGSTIPEVEAAANDAGASVAKNADGNVVKITVTAKNGTVKTYTITFNIKAAKTDATLKSISVGGAALEGFAADKIDYTVERAYGDSVVPEVTYEVNDADAKADKSVAGDVVTIKVTAQDGTTSKTYTITFTNKAPKTDATLKSISVNGTAIADFAADKYEYTVKLPYGSETQIGFELNDNDAKGTLKKLDTNVFAIEVTAQDGVTTKTYKITLDIESEVSSDATLKSLIVGGTPITLEEAKFEYECTLIDGFVKVVAVANHVGATVTIADAEGNVTDKFYGGTAVITVKAADNTTTNIYKVIFKSGTPGGIEDGGETGDGLITDITGSEDGGDV